MITLITGAPGSGKTLYTVDKLLRGLVGTTVKGQDEDGNPVEYPRRIYSNINGLLLDHEKIDAEWLQALHENKTTGAVVVFDEVQRVWPNRPTGSKKPAAVEYLETHRHDGIDLIIMTQNPQLLDPAVRALVGRHLHMRRVGSFGAAVVYEWDACSNSLNFKAAFTKTGYKYSRSAQQLYHSAKVHTKQTRKLPFVVWLMLAGVVGAAYMWPMLIDRITGKGAPVAQASQAKPVQAGAELAAPGAVARPGTARAPQEEQRVRSAISYAMEFRPRQPGQPHTAPRYDELTRPVWVPYPAMCVATANACRCYDQRGNRLDTPDAICRDYADKGFVPDFIHPAPTIPNMGSDPRGQPPAAVAPRSADALMVQDTPSRAAPAGADMLAWASARERQ